jgi:cytochrome P450
MIDFFSPEVRRNPFPLYDQTRAVSPLLHDPKSDLWMIFDYDGVKEVLTHHRHFSSSMFHAGRDNPEWMIFLDPPRQTKLRGLINLAFTPRVIEALEMRIADLSRELLDKTIERGEMDLVGDFATPLPMMVIAQLIGIPAAEWFQFRHWSEAILTLSYTLSASSMATLAIAQYSKVKAEMNAFVSDLIQQRRGTPADDLLTKLIHAEVDGARLSETEIIDFVELLIVAGQETTSNLISNAILCFLENPDQLATLRTSPDLLPTAIEEVLRYRSSVQWIFRATTCAVSLYGQLIPKGKLVLPIIGSANRDPLHFPEPGRFNITRNPNPHIAFGQGVHFCLGAPLARLEARVALTELLLRIKDIEPVSSEPWEPRAALHVYGPARLAIRFRPNMRAAVPA